MFQSINPKIQKTYDNKEWVIKAIEAQGFQKDFNEIFQINNRKKLKMAIPTELIPKCPDDGSDMTTNLRADNSFVEDDGWHKASKNYSDFLKKHNNLHILFLELGVGMSTPAIIKIPFWQMTYNNPKAVYACVNYGEAFTHKAIKNRSICIDSDITKVINHLIL